MVTEGFFKYPKFRGKGVEKELGKKKKNEKESAGSPPSHLQAE